MSDSTSIKGGKINLRRPDVMKEVQAEVVTHYRSQLVEYIRSIGNRLHIPGRFTIPIGNQI